MKASELIEALQKAVEAHGDLEVVRGEWDDWSYYRPVKANPHAVECKPHCSGFVPVSILDNGSWRGGAKFHEPYQTEIEARESVIVMHL